LNQITNLLLLLIVTSLFLPASTIMYANGSTEDSDESDSGSMEGDDASDDESMDDASDDESMDDASDTWSMEKSNNALASGSMEGDDASDDESMEMDDESDTWSMEKSNNALNPEPTGGGTDDGLSPLTSGPAGGTNDGLSPLTSGPTGTTNGLSPLTSGPTGGTNDGLSPLTSGFRIESNSTGNVIGNGFADTILPIMNQERALVGVPPLTWNNTLAADAQAWADRLVATGNVVHCFQVPGSQPFEECTHNEGENLFNTNDPPGSAPGTPSNLAKAAFDWWLSEKANYHGQPTGSEGGVIIGHYTQMVWKSTTQIGCASANDSSKGLTVVSCRFSPPGNIIGQTPY
jgi:uncharacterized protein YkwD